MPRLQGKTIILTAAAAGIGRESALAFAREGAHVIATDIDDAGLATLHQDVPSITVENLNVTDSDAIAAFFAKHTKVDVLFNVAGWVHHGTIEDCDRSAWDQSLALNLTAMYEMNRAALPLMLNAGGGNIINMSSVASSVTGAPNRFAYGATKAGVIGMTKAIAADYVGQNIRCNAICPGTVDTPSLQGRMAEQGDYDTARAAFIARQPMGRLGTAEEIAALATYLASDESGFVTGQTHVIDGGWTA
ncbi:MAG: SDR family oxidoreductase [Alphaproteobacteria bacterium]